MTPDRLAEIHRACFQVPRPWTEAEFADLCASPTSFLVPHAVGFALGRAVADEAELLTIAVLPDARRTGLGKLLMTGFLDEAARRGATSAFLEVSEANGPALALYRSAGFALVGKRRGYYRDGSTNFDALILKRDVGGDITLEV